MTLNIQNGLGPTPYDRRVHDKPIDRRSRLVPLPPRSNPVHDLQYVWDASKQAFRVKGYVFARPGEKLTIDVGGRKITIANQSKADKNSNKRKIGFDFYMKAGQIAKLERRSAADKLIRTYTIETPHSDAPNLGKPGILGPDVRGVKVRWDPVKKTYIVTGGVRLREADDDAKVVVDDKTYKPVKKGRLPGARSAYAIFRISVKPGQTVRIYRTRAGGGGMELVKTLKAPPLGAKPHKA